MPTSLIANDLIDFRLNGYRNEVTMKYGTDAMPDAEPSKGFGLGPCHLDDLGAWGFEQP